MSRQAPRGQLVTARTESVWKMLARYFAILLMGLESGSPATRKKGNTRRLIFLSSSLTFFPSVIFRFRQHFSSLSEDDIRYLVLSGASQQFTITLLALYLLDLMIASSEHGIGSRPPPRITQFLFTSAALLVEIVEVIPSGWIYVYHLGSNTATNSCDPVPSSSVSAHADGRL